MKKLQLSASMLSAVLFTSCVVEDSQQDVSLGQEESDIVGGLPTTITSNPWQVLVQFEIPNTNQVGSCGGSVLSQDWILTAQHCTAGYTANLYSVYAGTSSASRGGQMRKVAEIVNLPGYVDTASGKDMALLRLAAPLTIDNISVTPIAMLMPSQANFAADGVVARVTGWGTLASGGKSPDTLQTVDVNVVNLQAAKTAYGLPLSEDQLAAAAPGKDSCQGDSGGPLTVEGPNGRVLVGVVSWGRGCADAAFPGLYARVTSHYNWVKSVTGIADPVAPPSDPGNGGGDNSGGGDNGGGNGDDEADGSLESSTNDSSDVQGGCNASAAGAAGAAELLVMIATFLGLRRRKQQHA